MSRPANAGALALALALAACSSSDSELQLGEERAAANEAAITAKMISAIEEISLQRYPTGTVKRFNQLKTLGCFDAEFKVAPSLDKTFQQGLFVPGADYSATLRFANATAEDDRKKDFRGLSIKLKGVPGEALWGADGEQDFLLNSYPALFAANPEDFLAFIEAGREEQLWRYFAHPAHWYSLGVVLRGREAIANPFAIRYWSTTPYRFGDNERNAVKYSVRPCDDQKTFASVAEGRDFLAEAMQAELQEGPVCLSFMLQFQTDAETMPIENAAEIWEESESPFLEVAQIHISGTPSGTTLSNCESMTFNPWQSLAAHQPLGGINRVRRGVYAAVGEFRQQENRERAVR